MTSKPAIKEKLESNLEYLLEKDHRVLKEWDIKLKIIQENFLKVHRLLPNFSWKQKHMVKVINISPFESPKLNFILSQESDQRDKKNVSINFDKDRN